MIQTLQPGAGFLVQPGRITKIQLSYRGAKRHQPGFVPREWPAYIPPQTEKKPTAEKKETYKSRYTQKVLPLKP